ncbi:MAG: hypothetical protein KAJ19_23785 [Gammaproteobacteria bacterium]|nr:hypothetical protein [Gammaproteobacteria bacterium]
MSEQVEVLANAMIQLSTIAAEYEKQNLLVTHKSNLKNIHPQYIRDSFYEPQ